jgi:hypothetical protein
MHYCAIVLCEHKRFFSLLKGLLVNTGRNNCRMDSYIQVIKGSKPKLSTPKLYDSSFQSPPVDSQFTTNKVESPSYGEQNCMQWPLPSSPTPSLSTFLLSSYSRHYTSWLFLNKPKLLQPLGLCAVFSGCLTFSCLPPIFHLLPPSRGLSWFTSSKITSHFYPHAQTFFTTLFHFTSEHIPIYHYLNQNYIFI